MKLWLLQQINLPPKFLRSPDGDGDNQIDPWHHIYDMYNGFVIRAESEESARAIAQATETGPVVGTPWLDAKYSTCVEIDAHGEPGVVMADYKGA